jgi:hypothetical protein
MPAVRLGIIVGYDDLQLAPGRGLGWMRVGTEALCQFEKFRSFTFRWSRLAGDDAPFRRLRPRPAAGPWAQLGSVETGVTLPVAAPEHARWAWAVVRNAWRRFHFSETGIGAARGAVVGGAAAPAAIALMADRARHVSPLIPAGRAAGRADRRSAEPAALGGGWRRLDRSNGQQGQGRREQQSFTDHNITSHSEPRRGARRKSLGAVHHR